MLDKQLQTFYFWDTVRQGLFFLFIDSKYVARFAVVRNQEQCCWKGEPVGQHPGEDGQHKVAFGDVLVLRPIHATFRQADARPTRCFARSSDRVAS